MGACFSSNLLNAEAEAYDAAHIAAFEPDDPVSIDEDRNCCNAGAETIPPTGVAGCRDSALEAENADEAPAPLTLSAVDHCCIPSTPADTAAFPLHLPPAPHVIHPVV